jgi:UDP-glucose 4-epimerase
VKHFHLLLDAATYGIPEQVPVREDARTQPINPYGWSEADDRADAGRRSRAHPLNHCALRYFNVAGADPQGRSGQSTAGATHLIKVAVEAAIGKRGHVTVYGTDYPNATDRHPRLYPRQRSCRCPYRRAREADGRPRDQPRHELRLPARFSVLEVLDSVDRVTNMTIERRMEPRRAGDPDALVADNARILATLPWRPKRADLDTIVQDALAWERRLAERQNA